MAHRRRWAVVRAQSGRPVRTLGFTLVELLVVIVIIGVLTAIALAVAGRVTQGGRVRVTQDVLRVLNQTIDAYVANKESLPPSEYVDENTGNRYPIVDGRRIGNNNYGSKDLPQPSGALYFLAASAAVPEVDSILKGLDARLVQRARIEAFGVTRNGTTINGEQLDAVQVLDGFGQPIRFVHPRFQGGHGTHFVSNPNTGFYTVNNRDPLRWPNPDNGPLQIRRSYLPFDPTSSPSDWIGDADEGIGASNRPYFYSIGPDGDPGTRADNIYSQRPEFPEENARELR